MSGRALVANGDVTRVGTWSGIPYFFLQAGLKNGLFQGGVGLEPERLRTRRLLWNAARPLRFGRPGGYQYSLDYLERLWDERREPAETAEYVSHFPLLPPRSRTTAPVTYYLDATLHQNFEDYGFGAAVGGKIRDEALAREKEALHAARYVVGMSRWCAEDVKNFYGVPAERVRVILPGANLDDALVPPDPAWDGSLSPLRLGFIGKEWERKGGPVLLDVATRLEQRGHRVEVVVIGPDPASLPPHPSLRPMGFINKATDLPRFVEIVRTFHFGCLLSRVEALGISTLECLRLGVPVVGTDVGGIPDAVPPAAGFLVPVEQAAEQLTEALAAILWQPERYANMRAQAAASSTERTWFGTAKDFGQLLGLNLDPFAGRRSDV